MAKVKNNHVVVVLDMSGSMDTIRTSVIDAYNEYIKSLKKMSTRGRDMLFTLVEFNSDNITYVYNRENITRVNLLNIDTYVPAACTPLYDALGKTLNSVDPKKDKLLIFIMTDGLENASVEFSRKAIISKIKGLTDKKVKFEYYGANQDAWAVGMSMGVPSASSFSFVSTDEGTRDAVLSMSVQTVSYYGGE